MPDVFDSGSISESENSVFFIDRKNGSNILNIFFDFVATDRFSLLITNFAIPGHWVAVSSDLEGVEECNLFFPWDSSCLEDQDS